ncbi:unnamed protein product, partial [Musa acuminata subsp. burmannicoides]
GFIPTQLLSSLLPPRLLPPSLLLPRPSPSPPSSNSASRIESTSASTSTRPISAPCTFGDVDIFDAVLRIGPSKWSTEVGRAQGVSFHVSQRDESSLIPLVLVFTAGNFCDSTLKVIGRLDTSGKADRAIVGGTGVFQFASGNMVSKLVTSDDAGLVAAFDVYVVYYDDVRLSAIG